ncbi:MULTISPECIES: helix-turn-helix domain-containing protein [unclassified Candidatus Tisiphia]|uniref:helix-turn-helix domain-containing protein n=1 Tax=unclassified Candidatus Tisiphia TaxID=2996318 RepID=UPI00312CA329
MDAKIKLRLSCIKLYKQLEHAGKVCEHYGISRFTLRKWYKRYEVLGKNGLCDISSKPKNFPFQKRSEVDENLILDLFRKSLVRKGVKETLHLEPQRTLIPLRIRVPHHCSNHQQK